MVCLGFFLGFSGGLFVLFFLCTSTTAESEHSELLYRTEPGHNLLLKYGYFLFFMTSPGSYFDKQLVTESKYFIFASHPVIRAEVYLCYLPSFSVAGIILMYIFQCQYRTLMCMFSLYCSMH